MKIKAFISAALALLMLCACGRREIQLDMSEMRPTDYNKDAPLTCIAETQEEAETIAEQYGISLVSYNCGVATFYTEEDPTDVINRGMEQGWPELSLNMINRTF